MEPFHSALRKVAAIIITEKHQIMTQLGEVILVTQILTLQVDRITDVSSLLPQPNNMSMTQP